jgi:hypothetical protein
MYIWVIYAMPYKYVPKEVKVKLTKMRIIAFAIAVIIITIFIASLPYITEWYNSLQPITRVTYKGIIIEFRDDLRSARKIEVYPNESYLKSIFLNKSVNEVIIGVLNSTNQTGVIGVEVWEISFKLSLFYSLNGLKVRLRGEQIEKYTDLVGNSTNPVIIIIPPAIANETLVRVENYTVFISGKTLKDLDLATIKFIAVVLGI